MSLKHSLRIMVVDDMTVSRGLLMQAIEDIGISNADYAKSGDDAFAALVKAPFHLVISDQNMPGMTGLGLLENLRRHKSTQRIGFILVTGSPTQELIQQGQMLGMNNFLQKPFTTNGLKSVIEAVVGRL